MFQVDLSFSITHAWMDRWMDGWIDESMDG